MSSHSSPLKQNQTGYSSPSKVNGNIRNSPNKSPKNSKKTTIVSSPIAAQSIADTQSIRSQRSIVETVEEKVDPKLIEEKNKSKLNKIINESPNIEKDALSPTLLYVEIGPTLSINIESLCNLSRRLVVLRLTGTELPKPSIPHIESLRTLFLDQCKLKSLENFPYFPKLRYLNLSRNSLETFEGFPVYPDLEEFDIRNNKVEFNVDLALAAIASVSMNIYNGKKINENQIKQAFSRSPLIGYSLRQGFPAFNKEKSSKKSKGKKNNDTNEDEALTMDANNFLINQLLPKITSEGITTTSLIVNNESATVTLPIKGTNIKWFINTQPSDKHRSEWEHIPKSAIKKSERKTGNQLSQIITVTQMMYQHLIRCDFSLLNDTSNNRYSMYTLNVIGHEINKDKDELILPFPINPQVTGEPYEDSLVSLVPMPVPCRVSWYLENKLLHNDDHSIRLKEEYIDHEVSCLLQPYCKNMPEITFTHLLAKTNPVERLDPVVTNVYFPDDIIEGIEIKFEAHILPNREGQSEISIERAVSPSANWEKIKVLQPFSCNYTPTIDDVGCFLRCSYLPILNDGTRPTGNKPTIFYSKSRVIPGFPAFKNPMIAGDTRAGHSLVAIASYFGGRKGVCHYKWYNSPQKFKISSNSSNENLRRSISLSKMSNVTEIKGENTAILNIEKNLVGLYIAVEMTPIRNDDTIGEKVVACLNTPITQGGILTPLKKLPPNDQIVAYKPINVKIPVVWYRTNPDWRDSNGSATGFEKIFTGQEYTPTDRDVGNFLRLTTTKGESDVIIGEVKPSIPFIYPFELNIKGRKCEVGSVAEVPRKAISINSYNDDEYDDNDEDGDNGNDEYSGDGENGDGEDSKSKSKSSPKKKKKADNTYIKGVPKTALDEYYEDMKRRKKVEIIWVRMTKNNPNDTDFIERVVDIDTTTYTFTKMDVNSYIKAVVYPLDDEGNRFPPTHSKPTRLIKAIDIKPPVMKGELKVGSILSIDFKDFPIRSLVWERTKAIDWKPVYTFIFDHFDGDTPMYKILIHLDKDKDKGKDKDKDNDKDKYHTNLGYVVSKADIDYHIRAQIEVGEIQEIPDPSNPNQMIRTIVPSKLFNSKLKSSMDIDGKVSINTEGNKTKPFAMMERVVPDDLRISIDEKILNEPITEGQTIEVKIEGAGKKEILWETKVIKVRKSKIDKNKNEEYEKWETLYKGPSHTFTSDDLNRNFRVRCPVNEQIINLGFIQPSEPKISDFTIKQSNDGSIVILNAKYQGGIEGKSLYFYSLSSNVQNTTGTTTTYSYNDDNISSYIDNATLNFKKLKKKVVKIKEGTNNSENPVRMFTPIKDMFNKRIDIGIVPVREDDSSIRGKIRWSTNSIIVKSIPIVDAIMKYPNDDVDHLQVGMPITCIVTRCSMKNCSYKFTWKRYRPRNNQILDDDDEYEDENNLEKEEIKSNTTINNSSTYKLRQIDDKCFLVCQIVAVSENGFLSPIFLLYSEQIFLPGMKDYTLTISIPSRQGIADVKATKRSSGNLSRSEKIDGEIDTGDTLTPILNPEPKKGFSVQYEWQIQQPTKSPKKKLKKKSSNLSETMDDDFDEFANDEGNKWTTVSMEDNYTCSVLDLDCMIRCVCTIEGKNYSDMFESIPIGPVKINPKIEAPARSIIRANSFKMHGKAPSGNGQWDFLINSKGITITKVSNQSSTTRINNNNNEQFVKWPNVVCNLLPDEENQIEITTGPAMRIIVIPTILDKKRVAPNIQKNEVRDFCIFIINQFKKKDNENASNPA